MKYSPGLVLGPRTGTLVKVGRDSAVRVDMLKFSPQRLVCKQESNYQMSRSIVSAEIPYLSVCQLWVRVSDVDPFQRAYTFASF
jgi:hypothetical protein